MTKSTRDMEAAKLAQIRRLRASGKKWREIAARLGVGVNPGTVWKWAATGRAPVAPEVRRGLGLPVAGKGKRADGPRRVRYSERDTVRAMARTLALAAAFINGRELE